MHLRRIIKENHGSDIHQLAFFFNNKNFSAPVGLDVNKTFDKRGSVQRQQTDTSNVFASVGGCQMNLYDNEHIGDHLDLMSNFDLGQTEDGKSELHTFCWLYRGDDAQIAAAGTDGNIHLVSIAYSEEIKILQGHTKTIHDLQTHPRSDRYILSTSKDGTVRLWDVDLAKCLVIFEADATVTCFYTSGDKFISGGPRGELREWTIPDYEKSDDPVMVPKKDSRLLKKYNGECYIDCIRFANGNVLSKSINGRLEYWNPETGDVT
ncbi:WD40-repeat-containing domain protein [Syncephalastrum racemosum]|uniref:WD40-repeat-containing domain protein n=1 Tax=Syncephalastrum racemosum TaxID=13706 RepID=A0A1X2HIB2_SYNRA|nr:WD40-repeat-containing domain protein [Syncephalastrum racemosum]